MYNHDNNNNNNNDVSVDSREYLWWCWCDGNDTNNNNISGDNKTRKNIVKCIMYLLKTRNKTINFFIGFENKYKTVLKFN